MTPDNDNPIVCVYLSTITTRFMPPPGSTTHRDVLRALNLSNGWDFMRSDKPTPAAKEADYALHRSCVRRVRVAVRQDGSQEHTFLAPSFKGQVPNVATMPLRPRTLAQTDWNLLVADLDWFIEHFFDSCERTLVPDHGLLGIQRGRWAAIIEKNPTSDKAEVRITAPGSPAGTFREAQKDFEDGEVFHQILEFAYLFTRDITIVPDSKDEKVR